MKVGTRSLLFGAHQFLIHPCFVALAWWKLYGFPWDPRLWVAFFVHDLGYWGKPNMDGPEGDRHVVLGARIMGWLFDRWGKDHPHHASWYCFCYYHSRFMAKRCGVRYSRLCVADKLAVALEPWWFYLPRVVLSGEIREYMALARGERDSKYRGETGGDGHGTRRAWFRACTSYLDRWAYEHRNGKDDTWTPVVNHD